MKQLISKYKFLILILLLASLLRFIWLDKYPVSLNIDEVAIGYDAFSILKTGRDSHQKLMPLVFESIGDYKPGLYIYLTSVSEFFFGVNEFSVRFPSALAGVVTVFFSYLLARFLTKKEQVGLLTALVLSMLPWHIKVSRVASEANVAFCLLIIGFYLTLRAISKAQRNDWGLLFLCLSMYTYHTEKILVPLIFGCLLVIYRTDIGWHKIGRWLVMFVIFLLPFGLLLNWQDQSRAVAKFVRNDPAINISLSRVIGNENLFVSTISGLLIVRRYVQMFDLGLVVNKGLNMTHSTSLDVGWIYYFELPLLLLGLITLCKKSKVIFEEKRWFYAFLVWVLLSPIPASITMDDYHPFRLLTLTFPIALVVGVGMYRSYQLLVKRIGQVLVILGFGIMYVINVAYFSDYYMVHFPVEKSDWVFDPFKKVALVALKERDNYDRIIIDNNYGKLGPYTVSLPILYILFYGQVSPIEYFDAQNNDLSKFETKKIDWVVDRYNPRTLLIASPWSLPEKDIPVNLVKERIYFYDGTLAYLAVSTSEEIK